MLINLEFGQIVDHRLHHGDGRRVEGTIHPANLAHDGGHFRNGRDAPVLHLEHAERLPDRGVGHGGGHVKIGAFIEWRHELFAKSREGMDRLAPDRVARNPGRVHTCALRHPGHEAEERPEAEPDRKPRQNHDHRHTEIEHLMT